MKTTSKPTSELLGKLTRYTALAGAAGLGGNLAQAGITVWNSGKSITAPSGGSGYLYFDFETGTAQTTWFAGADFYFSISNETFTHLENQFFVVPEPVGSYNCVQASATDSAARLQAGDPISVNQNIVPGDFRMVSGTSKGASSGIWTGGGRGYLGFKFDIDGETHYGWADVTLENILPADGLPKITLHRFAYNETADEGILAGQTEVPEPESALPMALLVLGAAGLGRYRRQRAAQAGPGGEKTAT